MPSDRTAGMVMNYTSGTTGKPKGVRRALSGVDPETAGNGFGGMLYMFRLQPFDDNVHICGSPLYHTAVLVLRGLRDPHRAHRRAHGQVDAAADAPSDRQVPGDEHAHGADAVRAAARRSRGRERAKYDVSSLRHMVHAAAPCPPDVKRQMIEWWGPVIDEYYAASEGGGTIVFADEWLEHPGTVGRAWPISEIVILDDDGNEVPPGEIGTVYMHMMTGNFEYFKDKEKTDKPRTASSSPSATSASSTTTAGCSCRTARST